MWHEFRDGILGLLRTPVGTSCLLLLTLGVIALGVWLIAVKRFPSWYKGLLRWPIGDAVTPRVTTIGGCAYVLAGIGLGVATLADRASRGLLPELAILAILLAIASTVFIVWSTVLSRRIVSLTRS